MEWDKLLSLNQSYFDNLEPDSIKNLIGVFANWSKDLMPIGLWENYIIVATTKPLENKLPFEHILVKANTQQLEKFYSLVFNKNPILSETATIPDTPKIDSNNDKVNSLDFSSIHINSNSENQTELKEDIKEEVKAKIPNIPTKKSIEDINPNTITDLSFDGISLQDESTRSINISELKPKGIKPTPHPQQNNLPVESVGADLKSFLDEFEKVMILKYKDNNLHCEQMVGPWIKDPNSLSIVDLSSNSIFYFPFKTSEPYHGFVKPNPINDAFFNTFNAGSYPEHISVVPMYKDGNFIGELVGITSKEKGDQIVLSNLVDKVNALSKSNPLAA